ncbi:hypothetical protein BG004_001707 [Podila humilis]|nr:hypothetical protein BG004_001707 [Podila humilis]
MALVALKRFIDRQILKTRRSPFEYIVLGTLGVLVAAILKYPNRAFLTRARPDLKKYQARGYPLLGNMPQIIKNREDSLNSMNTAFKHFGDVFTITIPLFGRIILVNSPEIWEHVLKTNFNNYVKGKIFSDQLKDILGRGIFVADGDLWRFHRKTASNIFTTRLYRQLVQGAFRDSANDLIHVLERSQKKQQLQQSTAGAVDLQELFLKLTLDAFGKLTFGLEFNALLTEGPNEFGDAFDYLTANVDSRTANPFWFITDRIIPGKYKTLKSNIDILHKFGAKAIAQRRAEMITADADATTKTGGAGRARDLLDHFIHYITDDGTQLSDEMLEDAFINFMIAGRDTTAQGLTWQFYSLIANPRTMKNLVREVDIVLGKQSDKSFTYETIMQELPYMKAVFHETLRLYPPVPRNVKTVVEDDVLPGGVKVYKGDVIGLSTYCLGRNRAVWGEDAELFVPERWLVDDDDDDAVTAGVKKATHNKSPFGKFKTESPYKFTSFNAGPRLCLGQTFATLEAMVTTAMLLQRFKFNLVPGQPIPTAKPSVTLPMTHPLYVTVTNRI